MKDSKQVIQKKSTIALHAYDGHPSKSERCYEQVPIEPDGKMVLLM